VARRVLITGAGGPAGINFARALRLAPESFHLVGIDANPYHLQRAETDERYLVPRADEADYLPVLQSIVTESGAETIYAAPDLEVHAISKARDALRTLGVRVFFPPHETVELCQNKYLSYQRWQASGPKVPATVLLNRHDDLTRAFKTLGPRIWIRHTMGGAGRGSFSAGKLGQAREWIDFHDGWGAFIASEHLEAVSVTWQSIWHEGALVVAQGRKRLYWEFANRAPSGVTGQTGAGVTVSDPAVDRIAQEAIRVIDPRPHGIFSVDMTYDREDVPNPTEINIARFFTTHLFFARAGLNMPRIFVRLALGEALEFTPPVVNPLPPGLIWIRGIDIEPKLMDVAGFEAATVALQRRRRRVRDSASRPAR